MKTFARLYVDLELSLNGKFIAYGAMVKILAILKNICAKAFYLLEELEPVVGRVYLP